ncbi:MAG: hypothetical protein P8H35_04095 [Flavobacteriales bacterium]|nr:hypothetical protein [Flavobacteriales bacterium]
MKNYISLLFIIIATNFYSQNIIDVYCSDDTCSHSVIDTEMLVIERWDTLPQSKFWKTVINTTKDSCIINIASSRTILATINQELWFSQTEDEKKQFKDSINKYFCLDTTTKLYVTTGKKEFYQIQEVIPSIESAIEIFQDNDVDPWFAQSILLIESPAQLKYSSVGAYGPFQIMKRVARTMGLTVNRYVDERKDFKKSAFAASQLLKTVCIPQARKILCDVDDIDPAGNELWFKFLVLHVYHAGARNVGSLLSQLEEPLEGMELIQWMWKNEYGNFKNASQNYSQIAIAAMLTLNEIVLSDCDYILENHNFNAIEN